MHARMRSADFQYEKNLARSNTLQLYVFAQPNGGVAPFSKVVFTAAASRNLPERQPRQEAHRVEFMRGSRNTFRGKRGC
jgi:hypothetical protein